jgi:hypothetical protein
MLSEKHLNEIIRIVENFESPKEDSESNKTISVFFPEFEKAIQKSILFGELNKNALRRNLDHLYVKKFREERLEYITDLKKILETEHGKKFLKGILPN